ncbi:LysE family transporter [Amycolatopsis sp. K13G38]|uniref:LysE family transporter n=1 Tax=Amycolatopsis acididurans TaxID=2724524 RepID=A0ABX1IW41_9PSEU|nr:LysE family transporter [Amycolatopsis acididurans]NKQ51687.1 LysE family transporter [Amycolatopsis acididurans]
MTAAIVAGLLAGYGIAIPVGAVGAYLIALTAHTSLRVGAAAALGIATVDGVYALSAALGGSALVRALVPVAAPLRWIAAAALIAVAARTTFGALRRYRTPSAPPPMRPGRAYAMLVGMTLVNPTTIVYFVAVVLGGSAGLANTVPERSAFAVAAFAASASWQLALAGGGAVLGRAFTGRRGQLGTALASSAVIVILAARTAPAA